MVKYLTYYKQKNCSSLPEKLCLKTLSLRKNNINEYVERINVYMYTLHVY